MQFFTIIVSCILMGALIEASNVTENNSGVERRLAELEAKFLAMEAHNGILSTLREKRAGRNVAFSTVYTSNSDHHYIGEVVKFTRVLSNFGDAYSTSTGMFTAPESGVYLFLYHFAGLWHPGQAWLQLTHDGMLVNVAASDVIHENQDVQGSNSAIIHLTAGDRVWLEFVHQSDTGLHGSQEFTTFSGVLLF